MGINKIVTTVTVGLLLLVAFIYWMDARKYSSTQATTGVHIAESWKLPEELSEISGIAFLEEGKIAGIQDEKGAIFIYDLESQRMEREVPFGRSGDYEGIAIVEDDAIVLRSDGVLFKIANFLSSPQVSEHTTELTEKEDAEGLTWDRENNRLLIAIKEKDPHSETSKGIYMVELPHLKMKAAPALEIDLQDPIFEEVKQNKVQDNFKPSELIIHPHTGEVYVLEGQQPRLLILSAEGRPRKLYQLNERDFPQPEGLAFDASGNLYISSEGSPATIHRVVLNGN